MHNDGLLVLDEMGQADPKDIGDTVYMLANGCGKNRATKTVIPRKLLTWNLLALSSGELSLSQHMQTGGKKSRAGQELRMVDIPADTESGHGLLDILHHFPTSLDAVLAINERTLEQYGTAGHAFLMAITPQAHQLGEQLKTLRQEFMKNLVPHHAGSQVLRVASRFALVAIAGELASQHGITGWPQGEAKRAVKICFEAWIKARGGLENLESESIKEQARSFFAAHGDSRFADWNDTNSGKTIINRAGFRKKHDDGDVFAVLPDTYKNEICAGYDMRTVSKILITAGWLLPDKEGKAASRASLPGMGQTRAYLFTAQMWLDE